MKPTLEALQVNNRVWHQITGRRGTITDLRFVSAMINEIEFQITCISEAHMSAKQKKSAANTATLKTLNTLEVPLVKPSVNSLIEEQHEIAEELGEGPVDQIGFNPDGTPEDPCNCTCHGGELCLDCQDEGCGEMLAKKLGDSEAESDIKSLYDETHRRGFEIIGLASLIHQATCGRHKWSSSKDGCAFGGSSPHQKFDALAVAQNRALWVDYATQIANLSSTEAAQTTMALIFGKGQFQKLGKGRYFTKQKRAAFAAKTEGKKLELEAFLKDYQGGKTGDHKVPSAADQSFANTYGGGSVEEINAETEADIASFLDEGPKV